MNNRKWNCHNEYQGKYKRVLCVCSAGLLRSPTTALVLAKSPFNFNTRSCGLDTGHALIPIDSILLEWADEVVCMTTEQYARLKEMTNKQIVCLNIGDLYEYQDPKLISLIRERYTANT